MRNIMNRRDQLNKKLQKFKTLKVQTNKQINSHKMSKGPKKILQSKQREILVQNLDQDGLGACSPIENISNIKSPIFDPNFSRLN